MVANGLLPDDRELVYAWTSFVSSRIWLERSSSSWFCASSSLTVSIVPHSGPREYVLGVVAAGILAAGYGLAIIRPWKDRLPLTRVLVRSSLAVGLPVRTVVVAGRRVRRWARPSEVVRPAG